MFRNVLPIIAAGGPPVRAEAFDRPVSNAPLALLHACHQRIRMFTDMAGQVANAGAVTPDVAQAAAAVERYFFEALPKHVDDEEASLLPRLSSVPSCAEALVEMVGQHRALEEALAALRPHWRALALGAEQPGPLPAPLPGLTARMAALWAPHLELEERELFPFVEAMEPGERDAVWREMRSRRARTVGLTDGAADARR